MGDASSDVLLDYCTTRKEAEAIRLRLEGLSWAKIASQLGRDQGTLRRTYRTVRQRAARQGYSPEHDMTRPVPDGFVAKGVSTYYDEMGRPRGQWVKSQIDRERQAELLKAFAEGLAQDIEQAKPVKTPRGRVATALMPSIFIGDAHIGMRAFGMETKHANFDVRIATAQLRDAFQYLVDRSEPAKDALLVNVGDLVHANSQAGTTVSGAHTLDTDSRHYSVMLATAQCMQFAIDLLLRRHKRVTVVMARGNHDSDTAGAIQLMLQFYYAKEPRVNVLPSHGFVHYVEWHNWLLGIHHGDKMKPEKLASVMPRDMPEAWGRTTHRMWCTGHFHKEAVRTFDGVKHKVFAALPPPDSWHASHGFAGDGEMEMLTLRAAGGIHSSHVYNVPMPRVEPDARIDG